MIEYLQTSPGRRTPSRLELWAIGGSSLLAAALLWWTIVQAFADGGVAPRMAGSRPAAAAPDAGPR